MDAVSDKGAATNSCNMFAFANCALGRAFKVAEVSAGRNGVKRALAERGPKPEASEIHTSTPTSLKKVEGSPRFGMTEPPRAGGP